MLNSLERSWAENMIPSQVDSSRASFAGNFIGAIFYGMVILLFFQCMVALFNPYNHTKTGIRWGLVTHTVAMFLSVTIHTAVTLDLQFISCTGQQEFPDDGAFPGYNPIVHSVIPNVTFQLNQWLVDGLLLYRCRFKHATSYRAIALPCLLYLAAVAMGTAYIFKAARLAFVTSLNTTNVGLSYYLISLSLNVVLTLMIITRVVADDRGDRNVTRASGLYEAAAAMFTEPCSLYTFCFVLFVGTWWTGTSAAYIIRPILTESQIIAPFLVILREAKGKSSADDTSDSARLARSESQREPTTAPGGTPTLPDSEMSSVEGQRQGPGGLWAKIVRVFATFLTSPDAASAISDCFTLLPV